MRSKRPSTSSSIEETVTEHMVEYFSIQMLMVMTIEMDLPKVIENYIEMAIVMVMIAMLFIEMIKEETTKTMNEVVKIEFPMVAKISDVEIKRGIKSPIAENTMTNKIIENMVIEKVAEKEIENEIVKKDGTST